MAEYESIKGTRVKYLSSDPTLTNSSTEGQVWYNSTTGTNKVLSQIKATSSGGNLNTARFGAGSSGSGSQSSGLYFGGATAATTYSTATEEYNGFSWVNGGSLGLARYYLAGFGTQTAAVAAGGYNGGNKSEVEEYDGSSWSEVTDIPTAGRSQGAAGTLTAGLIFGAADSPQVKTFEYDGTNWTAGGDLNTGRKYMAGTGTQTAALAVGGSFGAPIQSNDTEEYDGSAWTSVNDINTARRALTGFGTQTSAAIGGGTPPLSSAIEEYDGTNWITSPATLSTARRYLGGFGSLSSAGVFCGGKNGTVLNSTEEYNSSLNTITQAVWSTGGTVNTIGDVSAGAGTMNAGLKFGGYPPSGGGVGTTATEEYNGSSWTSVNSMNTAGYGLTGTGLQTAAVRFGGYSGTNLNNTEEYDGTNWTAVTAVPSTISSATAFGVQTAAVLAGGYDGSTWQQDALEYDGTNFSSGGTFPSTTGAQYAGSAGTQTAGLYFGGYIPPSALGVTTISYDGSSWSAANNMLISRYTSGSGTQTAALAPGGYSNSNSINPTAGNNLACEQYDGTNWSNTCSNNITRGYQISSNRASNAPGTTGLVFGGSASPSPGNINSSEEFTGGTEVVTVSTLTTS